MQYHVQLINWKIFTHTA